MNVKTENEQKPLATKVECARFIGIKVRTLDKYVAAGRIPVIKLSQKLVRFDLDEVRAALR